MDVFEAIRKRRSVRRFRGDEIPEEALEKLEEALIWAPSAGNLQSRKFYFVFRRDLKEKLARAAYYQEFVAEAPLVVVACMDRRISLHYGERGLSLYAPQDVAASVQNLMLAATGLGLGSVWVGAFKEREVAEVMGLPETLRPLALVPVGYPGEDPSPPRRVSRSEAVVYVR
ncbi:MAG: nitroreductase family protein [Deltaproteobacteria bacterium]|nr:MAG: nitroreductase family protein [Deltaproteobacteria bacterium]